MISEHQRKYYVLPQGFSDLPQEFSDLPQGCSDLPQGCSDLPQGFSDLPQESIEKDEKDYHYIKVFSPQVKAEIVINYQITQIPKFELYFDPVQYYKTLKKNDKEYAVLYKIPQTFFPFKEYFKSLSSRELSVSIFESYKYLLKTASLLQTYEICYGNFSPDTICFNEKKNPILFDFESSSNYQDQIINVSLSQFKPLEIYMIHYLQTHSGRLSYSNIETICEDFSKNSVLFLSSQEKEEGVKKAILLLKPFVNVPSDVIMNYLQKYINTWDIYELNMMFLELSYELGSDVLPKHKKYMDVFINHLKNCLVLDPSKRENVQQMMGKFEGLFDSAC